MYWLLTREESCGEIHLRWVRDWNPGFIGLRRKLSRPRYLNYLLNYHQIHHQALHPQENAVQAMTMMARLPLIITPLTNMEMMIIIMICLEMMKWTIRTFLTQNSLPVRKYPFCWRNKKKIIFHLQDISLKTWCCRAPTEAFHAGIVCSLDMIKHYTRILHVRP